MRWLSEERMAALAALVEAEAEVEVEAPQQAVQIPKK